MCDVMLNKKLISKLDEVVVNICGFIGVFFSPKQNMLIGRTTANTFTADFWYIEYTTYI